MKPAFFLTLLSFCILKSQASCPISCHCTDSTISCINQDLKNVPDLTNLDISPNFLDFSGNKMFFISQENFNFPKCDEVRTLYLNSSMVNELGEQAFDELEGLQVLNLNDNILSYSGMPEDIIEDLDQMITLDLSRNNFDEGMPKIRSGNLKILVLNAAQISFIENNSLAHLPKLVVLYLEQNNIQNLSFEPFKMFKPESLTVKLSYNPFWCTCDNLRAFQQLADHKLINTLDPYFCTTVDDRLLSIFKDDFTELLKDCAETEDMVNDDSEQVLFENDANTFPDGYKNEEKKDRINSLDDKETHIQQIDQENLKPRLPTNCWYIFTDEPSNDGFFIAMALTTLISFVIGFSSGILFCKLVYTLRYKKLEQGSDSQVQLIKA
ncbi:leucine-rich repeat-containing protein 38-like [Euwallacea fornicatus]|uniref:leucine-rich repeat-containing protein 38-like n=1 Tax=Euwallacea fornicatus TaxID=995702 RepID=UPI00338E01C3